MFEICRLQSEFSLVLLDIFGWENYSICSFEQLCINTVNEALQSTYNAVIFTMYQVFRYRLLVVEVYTNLPFLISCFCFEDGP